MNRPVCTSLMQEAHPAWDKADGQANERKRMKQQMGKCV